MNFKNIKNLKHEIYNNFNGLNVYALKDDGFSFSINSDTFFMYFL